MTIHDAPLSHSRRGLDESFDSMVRAVAEHRWADAITLAEEVKSWLEVLEA